MLFQGWCGLRLLAARCSQFSAWASWWPGSTAPPPAGLRVVSCSFPKSSSWWPSSRWPGRTVLWIACPSPSQARWGGGNGTRMKVGPWGDPKNKRQQAEGEGWGGAELPHSKFGECAQHGRPLLSISYANRFEEMGAKHPQGQQTQNKRTLSSQGEAVLTVQLIEPLRVVHSAEIRNAGAWPAPDGFALRQRFWQRAALAWWSRWSPKGEARAAVEILEGRQPSWGKINRGQEKEVQVVQARELLLWLCVDLFCYW